VTGARNREIGHEHSGRDVTGTRQAPAKPKTNKRRPRVRVDKRYALGRRAKELEATFAQRLGADAADIVLATAITRCAEVVVISEDLRARMLRGEAVSPDDVLRLTRTADALTRRLHLDRHKAPPASVTLADYLRAREAEEGGA
jgi:hypothetical protein